MAAGEDEGRDSGGGEGGGDGDATEVDVDATVPAAPDLGGREHASATAHVTEGSLASAVGSAAGNTGDTGHRTPRSPGLRGGLVTGAARHRVGLAAVAGQELVDEADDIGADRRAEDVRQRDAGGVRRHIALQGPHGDQGARGGGHLRRRRGGAALWLRRRGGMGGGVKGVSELISGLGCED